MKIRFRCQNCHRVLAADDQYAGARFHCPGCRQVVVVPRADALATAGARPAKPEEEGIPAVKFQRKSTTDDEIDMTPMIDCVFLLLIFFLVTATFALQKSHEVPPPERQDTATKQARTVEQLEADEDFVIVKIEKDKNQV